MNKIIKISSLDRLNDANKNFQKEAKIEFTQIVDTFVNNICDNIKSIKNDLDCINSKSYIIYRIGFVVELTLKYILFNNNCLNLAKIIERRHNIYLLFNDIENSDDIDNNIKELCFKIKHKLSLYKNDNNHSIMFGEYSDYRYNLKEKVLLNNNQLIRKDILHSKEIIECIEKIIEKK